MILRLQPEVKFADCAPSLQQGMPQLTDGKISLFAWPSSSASWY